MLAPPENTAPRARVSAAEPASSPADNALRPRRAPRSAAVRPPAVTISYGFLAGTRRPRLRPGHVHRNAKASGQVRGGVCFPGLVGRHGERYRAPVPV